eukprot:5175586-Pyramimonas_sp.AAC.1
MLALTSRLSRRGPPSTFFCKQPCNSATSEGASSEGGSAEAPGGATARRRYEVLRMLTPIPQKASATSELMNSVMTLPAQFSSSRGSAARSARRSRRSVDSCPAIA